jgi:hypothetical protein
MGIYMSTLTTTNSLIHNPTETKHDKFRRLSQRRLESALDNIRLIENLLRQENVYAYNHQDVELITNKLQDATNRIKSYWSIRYTKNH